VVAGENLPTENPTAPAPRARALFRQGAIYGLAGALKAADVAVAAARGAVRGAREGMAESDGQARERSPG
jgi:hypothetical protein